MRTSANGICVTLSALLLLGACSGKHDDAAAGNTAAAGNAAAAVNATPAATKLTMPKPGLWEMTVSTPGMPKPMKTQMCIGAPVPGANPFAPPPRAGQNCARSDVTRTATGYSIDMECKMNGMTMSTKGEVSGDFSSNYKTVMTTSMSGAGIPAAMQTERTSTAESRYIGACPADMKPGTAKQAG